MLYFFLEWLDLQYDIPGFGVFRFISFRSVMAIIFSLIISLLIGKKIINLLRRKLIGESIRDVGPESHKKKAGTPTMGGLIIIAAIVIPTLLWGDLTNGYVLLILISTLWIGVIGFVDDYIKVFKKDKSGLKGKFKVVGQVGLGLIVGMTMLYHPHFKGKKGVVYPNSVIFRPGPELQQMGFQHGDQLVRMNDQPVWDVAESDMIIPAEEELAEIRSYTIERENEFGETRSVRIEVPTALRKDIGNQLFYEQEEGFEVMTNVPFLKSYVFDYSALAFWSDNRIWGDIIYILVVIFIVTAVSNAVNITDGLDGLAAGTSAVSAVTLAIFSYVSGNIIFSNYLNISYIPMSAELAIYCAAMLGACVGFLWYNTHPAQVFMGDTGSLTLGGAIGVIALMVKKELLIPIICGVFLIESLSVIFQVAYFKYTKKKYGEGRRILRMAPLHHHYELTGLHEAKIVTRFWIAAIFLAVLAFATLKLR